MSLSLNRSYRRPFLFIVLSVLLIGTMGASLWLNQRLLRLHAQAVQYNLDWGLRMNRYSHLAEYVLAINIPCNDIFETKNIAKEYKRFREAIEAYEAQQGAAENDLEGLASSPVRADLQAFLKQTHQIADTMSRNGENLFMQFKRSHLSNAGTLMAQIDRENAAASSVFRNMSNRIREHLLIEFSHQQANGQKWRLWEISLAALFLPLGVGLVFYGNRLAEALEKSRDEALQASRAKSHFLANMSHEIRTPMNGILGMSHIVLDGTLPEEPRKQVEIIQSSAQALLTLLNDILDFSKIEAGKLVMDRVAFNVRQLFGALLPLIELQAREKGLLFQFDMASDVPVAVWGDPHRLRQIATNLLSNAIKFTPFGEVTLHVYTRDVHGDQQQLVIDVQDSGIGMSPDFQERLFRPFEQVDASTTRRFGGTGLGLAITHQLVFLMKGQMEVQSALGKGTRFLVTVPAQTAPNPVAVTPSSNKSWVEGLRILLAEDNPVNQAVVKGILKKGRHHITVVDNGRKAVEAYEAQTWDLILMDQQMPEMSGLEATQKIRSIESTTGQCVPIIALTASAMSGDRDRCLAAGMNAYISKPFDPAALLRMINHVYRNTQDAKAA